MAGYNTGATYVNDDVVNASDTKNEFSEIDNAFDENTGHKHDGSSSGEGPQLAATVIVNAPSSGITETDVQGAVDNLGGRMNTAESSASTQDGRLDTNESDIDDLEAIDSGTRLTAIEDTVDTSNGAALTHGDSGNASGVITVSTSDPSGTPADGDIWIKYTA